MAVKKSSKSSKISSPSLEGESAPVKVAAPVKAPPVAPDDPIVPIRKYLMGGRAKAHRIEAMAVWAESQGWSVARVSQWKKLFENF